MAVSLTVLQLIPESAVMWSVVSAVPSLGFLQAARV